MGFNFIKLKPILLLSFSILAAGGIKIFGQDANIDQIRNSNLYPNPPYINTAQWANGNANSTQAHYMESHSIGYRSLLTGLVAGNQYTYYISYETEVSSIMAIDYLTHFQRLLPHGVFGHTAETVNPLILLKGSTLYNFPNTVISTYLIPQPTPTGSPVAGQPQNSWQNLYNADQNQLKMTGYDATITNIQYNRQDALNSSATKVTSGLAVTFTANNDSAILAWGGHIASRLDWGFINPTTPRSAAGISGSPYHMRNDSIRNNTTGVTKGLGSTDRQLSAAAVVPPPACPTVTSLSHCYQDSSFTFSVTSPIAGVTYTWSLANNTIGAVFSSDGNVGTSVTVIAHPGPDTAGVNDGGSFSLNINVAQSDNGQDCNGVATGTLVDVDVAASAYSTAIDIAVKDTTHLTSTTSGGGTAPYTFLWRALEPGSSFATGTSQNTVVTVPHQAGTYTYHVIATDANGCQDSASVQIIVSAGSPACGISGPTTICPGSTNTYKYDTNSDQTADPLPTNFTAVWKLVSNTNNATTSGSTTGNTVSVVAGSSCSTAFTVRIVLTSTSGIIKDSCDLAVSVNVTSLPTITCPGDASIECSSSIPTPPTTTQAALQTFFTNAGGSFTGQCTPVLSFTDERTNQNCFTFVKRTWTVTDGCGNTASCTQTIKVVDRTAPTGTCAPNVTVACGAAIQIPVYTDNCGGTVTVFFKDNPVGAAANRLPLTRTWTFVDPSGNTATCVQNITFQTCSTFVSKAPVDQQVNTTTQQSGKPKVTPAITELQVQAYPNPFNSSVNFVLVSPVSGKANLEIYDMLGRRLAIVYQGSLQAGVQKTINYRVPTPYKVPIVYKLSVGSNSSRGKLLPDKVNRQ